MKKQYKSVDYVVIADNITAEVHAKLLQRYKNYNILTIGVTGGMAGTVNIVGLEFQISGPVMKNELRQMLVDSVEEFLIAFNSNIAIRPYLKNYPFTSKEINVGFFIGDCNGKDLFHPDISVAYTSHGKIFYRTVSKDNIYGYKSKEDEDYETAKKIVQDGG